MQSRFPVTRHALCRAGHGLLRRVVRRRREPRTLAVRLGCVAPEPILARLVALDDGMPGLGGMAAGVLRGRRVAAAHVAAPRTTTEMEPPALRCEAFDAARSARRDRRVDLP